ncbi:membrane protein insertase YidC [Enterococcus timonensis]|uniref:membrane protein insertase YidC n=1 Tax=Enterococcus timonensis TaxID=1852364 RepID=UPI0008D97F2A|nr:membrane protein insertase YidC [Enterococcus timonensis]
MKKLNKWLLTSGLFGAVLFLSGCVQRAKDGTPTGEGWVYLYLVRPMSFAMDYFADLMGGNYGLAIILITMIVRLIILPLGLHQSRSSIIQQEKMAALKPQMDQAQANLKAATTTEEQRKAQMEMSSLYKENGVSMTGGIGCLPLLIQMPIFSALFYAAQYTEGISTSVFFGVNLGERNLIFVALAGLSYLGVSLVSMIGVPDSQRKTMRTMMLMNPLMILFFSFSSPAGVTLYWIVGGIFSMLQTYISNVIMKPKIKAKISEELKQNPPKTVIKPVVRKDVTPEDDGKSGSNTQKKNRNRQIEGGQNQGRNSGKQQHK